MKPRTLATLGIITAAAAGFAAYSLWQQESRVADTGPQGPLCPGLAERVNDAASVKVTRGVSSFTVTLKDDGSWGIVERGGYPAKFETVKAAIVGLAGLTIQEARTNKPEQYAKIGVEDATKDGATSTLVTVADSAGKAIASVIIGKPKTSTGFNAPPDLYARREGEAQSWLVRPPPGAERIDIRSDPNEWVDRNIVQVGRDRVKTVTITHPDAERVDITKDRKEDPNWRLVDMPPGRELTYVTACDAVAGALSSLTLEDVKPSAEISFEAPGEGGQPPSVATSEFRAWDGLVIVARTAKIGEKTWARFEARYEEPPAPPAAPTPVEPDNPDSAAGEAAKPDAAEVEKVKQEAADLQARLSPWVYAIAEWQSRHFTTRLADLLKPLPGEPEKPPAMPEGIQPLVPEAVPIPAGRMGPAPGSAPPPPPP